ncbi:MULTISPECIES: FMN-binding protein [unclassified Nocardioides]|uniref:FMN-binding protein n=1 Tax=unclassified Nocardioides TaxID=2615069 RepID=UPI001153758E|nr:MULTISPECIES: FMN-binding protein [unclassified Nocardioides]WGY04828.1 FMN-binding protein [Nocardioides sp. QY071]
MRRIALWFAGTVSVVVLLFSHQTSTGGGAALVTGSSTITGTITGSGSGSTVTGDVAQTRWGPVQVALSVDGGTITAVQVPQYPDGNGHDQEINSRALPVLVRETLAAQSASIDMVSGATVTSTGYRQSLQSALDKAGL